MCLVNDSLAPYVTLKAKSEIVADTGLRLKHISFISNKFCARGCGSGLAKYTPLSPPRHRKLEEPTGPAAFSPSKLTP